MQIAAPANAVAGVMPSTSSWPSNVVNQVCLFVTGAFNTLRYYLGRKVIIRGNYYLELVLTKKEQEKNVHLVNVFSVD